jgi:hypothetical protein
MAIEAPLDAMLEACAKGTPLDQAGGNKAANVMRDGKRLRKSVAALRDATRPAQPAPGQNGEQTRKDPP